MIATLRFVPESGGYTVMIGDRLAGTFIGRVTRSRGTYHHSNGRTYRSWSWSAFPPITGGASFQHRTRAEAGRYLLKCTDLRK